MKKISKKWLIAAGIIVIAASFAGWKLISISRRQNSQTRYQTAAVEKGTIVSTVSASGQVLAANIINLTTESSGMVKAVYVQDGDTVKVGQKIAEIEPDQAGRQQNAADWSSYLSAKNSVDSASSTAYTLRSAKDTAWKKFYDLAIGATYQNADGTPRDDIRNSSADFQSAQADWLAAEAKYKNQQAVITQTKAALNSAWLSYQQSSPIITAPMSGKVENITIVPGIMIGGQDMASQTIAVIRNEGNPLASFNFPEIDIAKVKIGQKVTVTLDAIAGKTFTGKVVSVDKIGRVVSNVTNYPAIVQLDTGSEDLLPNMSTTTNVIIETKDNVLFVPSPAIQIVDGQATVRMLKKGQIQQVFIETGISGDNGTEITSGLSEADEIIIGAAVTNSQQGGASPFGGGGFGGGALSPGGFGGSSRMQH